MEHNVEFSEMKLMEITMQGKLMTMIFVTKMMECVVLKLFKATTFGCTLNSYFNSSYYKCVQNNK